MTLLDYRPELAIARVDDSSSKALPPSTRDTLRDLHEQITALVVPLTRVQLLSEAERLASLAAPDYIALATQRAQLLSADAPRLGTDAVSPLTDSIRESALMSNDIKEQLYGALESFAAYVDWFHRNNANTASEDKQRTVTAIVQHVQDYVAQAGMALSALKLVLSENSRSTSESIPVLAELVDRCWTEVEDVFLSLAKHDDEGGTVPLSEVKAELGL